MERLLPNFIKRLYKKPPPRCTRPIEAVVGYYSFTTPAQMNAYEEALLDRMRWADGVASEPHLAEPYKSFRGQGGRRLCDTMRAPKGHGAACLELGGRFDVFG